MRAGQNGNDGKLALVLAGGGLTGAVYEIGALRAIDDLLVDRSVADFDIFVGTSSGALVAAMIANGLTPEDMLQVIDGSHPEIRPIKRQHIFEFNTGEFLRRSLQLPQKLLSASSHYLRFQRDMTFFDLLWSLTEVLPSGIYDSLALEGYTRYVLSGNGRTNRFEQLARDLYIIATDLDNGKRVVFGRNYRTDVSISLAVAASSALPLVYKPVRIGEHEYVDGGLRGTASLDLAIEHGATLVICINPLVPYDNSDLDSIPFLGADGGHLSQKGMQSIASQVSRISTHSGLHYHLKQLRRSHPEVDIILIEPHPDDYQMFFYNIMRYSARLTIAEHGFESVTLGLTEDYSHYKEILARHAIPITRRLVSEELTEIQDANYDPTVVRRVLESRSASYGRSNRDTPVGQLTRSLAELELAIDRMMMQAAGPPDAEPAAPEPAWSI